VLDAPGGWVRMEEGGGGEGHSTSVAPHQPYR
jgi:hypothetical protein